MPVRALLAGAACLLLLQAMPQAATGAAAAPPVAILDDLQLGLLLMEGGRLDDARAVLERAQPTGEAGEIERRFLLGRVAMLLGEPREAITLFESILAVHPDLTRVRLELAAAYLAAGRDRKARHHFEAALADRPPPSVESAVRDFLDHIDARKRWSAVLSFALAPETNPNKRTGQSTVRIGGAPFVLDEDAKAASGTGLFVSSGLSFTPALGDDTRAVLAASAAGRLYRRSSWNDITGEGELGLARLFDQASLSGGLRIGRRWLANRTYSDSVGPWVRGRIGLSSALSFGLSADADAVRHDDFPERDGWRLGIRPNLYQALGDRTSLEVALDLGATTARANRHANRAAGIRIALQHAFGNGLTVAPEVSLRRQRYGAPDPLFGKTRMDTNTSLSVNARHHRLEHAGFAPYIGYTYEINRSTLPFHNYRNHAVVLGVSRSF